MTTPGPSGYQTSHQQLCAMLRELLIEAVQAGRRTTDRWGSTPGRAMAALYLLLLQHPIDHHGRCRSCRRPPTILGGRRRRCGIHREARVWLHQPADFLRTQLARELNLNLDHPPPNDPAHPHSAGPHSAGPHAAGPHAAGPVAGGRKGASQEVRGDD